MSQRRTDLVREPDYCALNWGRCGLTHAIVTALPKGLQQLAFFNVKFRGHQTQKTAGQGWGGDSGTMHIRVLGQSVQISVGALALTDAGLFAAVFYSATMARFGLSLSDLPDLERRYGSLWPRAVLFSAVMLVCLLAFGLYSARQRAQLVGLVIRVAAAVAAATSLMAAALYIVPDLWIDRGVVLIAAIGATATTSLLRVLLSRTVAENLFKRRVLVYGTGARAGAIARLRRRCDRRGFLVVGFVQPDGEASTVSSEHLLNARPGLIDLCNTRGVHEVVVAMDDRRRGFPIGDLLECRFNGMEVTELLTFLERETGRVRVDVLNPSWMIFGDGFKRGPMHEFASRALDLFASSLILAAALPVILLTAVAIKLEDGWRAPVFYRQARVGMAGRSFDILKFRSMHTDAECDGNALWAEKCDRRVTRVGALIRKLRIDELPQVFNVLQGQMSFIGPRPERPQFVTEFSKKIPYYVLRHCVKPGITGWAQLCYPYGSSEHDALEKLQYDLYYIKNKCLLLDLAILVQTVEVVLLGKGAR
jgi:sugar transferase (PEP-CTERM system associated)